MQLRTGNSLLLSSIRNNLRSVADGAGTKFVLYAGHESTLNPLLSILGIMDMKCIMDNFYQKQDYEEEECY